MSPADGIEAMKKRRLLPLTAMLTAAAVLAGAGLYVRLTSVHPIQNVSQVQYSQGRIYGIDLKDEYYVMFRLSIEDNDRLVLALPVTLAGWEYSVDDLQVDSQGQAMACVTGENGEERYEAVFLMDSYEENLTEAWDIPQVEGQTYWKLVFRPDGARYAVTKGQGRMLWYALKDGQEASLAMEFDLPFQIHEAGMGDGGGVWAADNEGNLYTWQADGSLKTLFANDGSQLGLDNTDFQTEGDMVRFYSHTREQWYGIRLDSVSGVAIPLGELIAYVPERYSGLDVSGVRHDKKDNIYYGLVRLEDGRQVPMVYGAVTKVIDQFSYSAGYQLKQWVKLSLMGLACAGAYGLVFYAFWRRKGGFPVWGQMVLAAVPILAAGFWLLSQITAGQMEGIIEDGRVKFLANYGNTQVLSIDYEAFGALKDKEQVGPEDVEGLFLSYEDKRKEIYWIEDGQERGYQKESMARQADRRLFYLKDGEFYSASGDYQFNVPMAYQTDWEVYQAMVRAKELNRAVFVPYNDNQGRWFCVFTPVTDGEGQVMGVVQSYVDIRGELAGGIVDSRRMQRGIGLVFGGLLGVMLVIVMGNMYPLGKVRRAVLAVSGGQLNARVQVGGTGEAAGLGLAFNRMMARIEAYMADLELLRRKYAAFVPQEELRLMGRRDVREAALGDEAELVSSLLAVREDGGSREELFDFVNGFLSWQLPAIKERGGMVHRFEGTGMECLFPESPAAALDSAVSLLQRMEGCVFRMGLSYGQVRLGILGEASRASVVMVSEQEGLAWFLVEKAKEYDAALLATSRFYQQAGGEATGYHCRILGYIYLRFSGRLELVFQVLDGERREQRLLKERTKERFEAGVRAFMAGGFVEARRLFILVLEENERDLAARRYVRLCQDYMDGKRQGRACLDIY